MRRLSHHRRAAATAAAAAVLRQWVKTKRRRPPERTDLAAAVCMRTTTHVAPDAQGRQRTPCAHVNAKQSVIHWSVNTARAAAQKTQLLGKMATFQQPAARILMKSVDYRRENDSVATVLAKFSKYSTYIEVSNVVTVWYFKCSHEGKGQNKFHELVDILLPRTVTYWELSYTAVKVTRSRSHVCHENHSWKEAYKESGFSVAVSRTRGKPNWWLRFQAHGTHVNCINVANRQ